MITFIGIWLITLLRSRFLLQLHKSQKKLNVKYTSFEITVREAAGYLGQTHFRSLFPKNQNSALFLT